MFKNQVTIQIPSFAQQKDWVFFNAKKQRRKGAKNYSPFTMRQTPSLTELQPKLIKSPNLRLLNRKYVKS